MPIIAVNHAQMQASAAQVRSSWARLESHYSELQSLLSRLHSGWSGADRDAHQAHQNRWNEGARNLNQVLSEIGKSITTASDNLRSATQTNVRSWPV